MKQSTLVTADSLRDLIQTPNPKHSRPGEHQAFVMHLIGKALVALFERQTADEQSANTTNKHNSVGFAGCDAKSGSLTAKFYIKHKRLEQWMVDNWIRLNTKNGYPRICKYHRQLNEVAYMKHQENELHRGNQQ